ncbi:ABC transporter permease subunit [Actinoplanes philippinensis]|uniref:ABC transporter permease subunit n=1 Tax=Actinoplanes philippinensis TaxID=35752 RepID=UPI0033EB10AE
MSLLRAEWTKFRSVRGWVLSSVAAVLMILLFPVTGLSGGAPEETAEVPTGPDGEPVTCAYYFVRRSLSGDGQLTAEVTGLSTLRGSPWAKAGLLIAASPEPGARYAAVMITRDHGVRMQHDYLHDRHGPAAGTHWLRLTRSGAVVTGEASADGAHWSVVDTVRLPDPAITVEAGLFVAAPPRAQGLGTATDVATATFTNVRSTGHWATVRPDADPGDTGRTPSDEGDESVPRADGGAAADSGGGRSTDTNGGTSTNSAGETGAYAGGASPDSKGDGRNAGAGREARAVADGWTGVQVGAETAGFGGYPPGMSGGFTLAGKEFTVTGTGDLGPAVRSEVPFGATIGELLAGTFPAMVVIVVAATLMWTTEYRYGLIRSTLAVGPHRVRVLAAKAAVFGGVTFVTTLAATAVAIPVWSSLARGLGVYLFPAGTDVMFRVAAGTAAVLAGVGVLALGAGVILRRSATAVTAVVAVTVLPYLLALTPFVPGPMAQWLARVTPAAAMAVQQTLIRYPQVDSVYTPANGYYPLSPWGGLAVLGGWMVVVLAVAAVLLRRRDA